MWVWEHVEAVEAAKKTALLSFAEQHRVQTIYLEVSKPKVTNQPFADIKNLLETSATIVPSNVKPAAYKATYSSSKPAIELNLVVVTK